jgi:hypothetical protein
MDSRIGAQGARAVLRLVGVATWLAAGAVVLVLVLAGSCSSSGGTGGSTPDQCNPVTSAGCSGDGFACDFYPDSGYFVCYAPPNPAGVCGSCSDLTTTCGAGSTCVLQPDLTTGTCYRYCCTDADCGSGGTCDTAFLASLRQPANADDVIGLCVTSTTDGGPACDPPVTAPSGGVCVGGFPGSVDGGAPDGLDGGEPADGGGSHPEGGPLDAG